MEKETSKPYTIKVGTLALIIGMFIIGFVSAIIVTNQNSNEEVHFSTLELVNFVISILLSCSSLVLAILAINLGKSSEKMMVDRSDESIKLQNEVFSKTIEALGRIESSTGVTEKRIEDIISGRAGDIADRLLSDKIVHKGNRQQLEEEIRASLRAELSQNNRLERQKKEEEQKKQKDEAWKNYTNYKEKIMISFANLENVKALRISDGSFTAENEDLLDGLFEKENEKIGVCTFSGNKAISTTFLIDKLDEFINNLAIEITKETFNKVYLVFDEDTETTEKYKITLERIKKLMKPEIADSINLIISKPEELRNNI